MTRAQRPPGVARSARAQLGRTLIELMIAMTISVSVLFGLSVYYADASRTASVSHQMGSLNQEAPLAMLIMGQSIKRAGYGEIVGTGYVSTGQTMFDGPHLRACRGGTFADPSAGDYSCVVPALPVPDTLMVSFQGDATVAPDQFATRNCAGALAVPTLVTNPAHVANGSLVPLVRNVYSVLGGRLVCAGNDAAAEILAHDVVDLRVFFGFDDAGAALALAGGVGVAPTGSVILDADQVIARNAAFAGSSRSAWDFVVAVHLCLVMKTRGSASSAVEGAYAYTGCPTSPAQVASGTGPALSAADGSVHKRFTQVYTVRSRATGSPSVSM
ncbi:MAG: PilW family protein [Lautropia sp.]